MWSNNDGMDPNWKPDYTPKTDVVGTLKEEIAKLKAELDAACEHVQRLCEERSRLRAVADAAKDVVQYDKGDGGTRLILECHLQGMESALKELEIEK